jgi:uncharacterized membrane protein
MTERTKPTQQLPSPLSLRMAWGRLFLSVAVGAIALWFTPSRIEWTIRAAAGWDAASLTLLALAWNVIRRADARETKRRAGMDDPGRDAVFVIALVAGLISLFAATVVLREVRDLLGVVRVMWTALTLAAVALSWAVTHTAYTLRYAHLHYSTGTHHHEDSEGGLQFSGTKQPSDIDFAYFAFTIGMCFQVSDVVVTATGMRREVLIHAVISFVYNTVILAVALNVAISLMS